MDDELPDRVQEQAARMLRGQKKSISRDLATFGIVGWSIALPTMLGIGLGIWVDNRWPSRASWTLILLFVGLVMGCVTAWRWIEESSP